MQPTEAQSLPDDTIAIQWPFRVLKPLRFDEQPMERQRQLVLVFRNNMIGLVISLLTLCFLYFVHVPEVWVPFAVVTSTLLGAFVLVSKLGWVDRAMMSIHLVLMAGTCYLAWHFPGTSFEFMLFPVAITSFTDYIDRRKGAAVAGFAILLFFYFVASGALLDGSDVLSAREQTLLSAYAIGLAFLSTLALVLSRMKADQGYSKVLQQKHEQAVAQQEKAELSYEESLEQLEAHRKDMEALTSYLQLLSKHSENTIAQIKSIRRSKEPKEKLKALSAELQSHAKLHERIKKLQRTSDPVNTVFFSKLSSHYPTLSRTEKEICALIKLNLTTKEIANLRNTSEGSIYVTKNRMRKKMQLAEAQDLYAFVQQL